MAFLWQKYPWRFRIGASTETPGEAPRQLFNALHEAIEAKLSKQAVLYREAHPSRYRLFQMADYACTMELAAIKYSHGEATETDKRFLGKTERLFRKNHLKAVRRKMME